MDNAKTGGGERIASCQAVSSFLGGAMVACQSLVDAIPTKNMYPSSNQLQSLKEGATSNGSTTSALETELFPGLKGHQRPCDGPSRQIPPAAFSEFALAFSAPVLRPVILGTAERYVGLPNFGRSGVHYTPFHNLRTTTSFSSCGVPRLRTRG